MPQRCPNCNARNNKKARYCFKCGIRLENEAATAAIGENITGDNEEAPPVAMIKEFFEHVFELNKEIGVTFLNLVRRPLGKSLVALLKRPDKYKKSISYFLTAVALYVVLTELVLKHLQHASNYELSGSLGNHVVVSFILGGLLLILGLIGYLSLGWSGFRSGRRDYYSFFDVIVICLFIYGTNYFLAPFVVLLSTLLDDTISNFCQAGNNHFNAGKLTDLPLVIFMAFMLFMLIKNTPDMKYRYWRFLLFLTWAYTYYYFTFDLLQKYLLVKG